MQGRPDQSYLDADSEDSLDEEKASKLKKDVKNKDAGQVPTLSDEVKDLLIHFKIPIQGTSEKL